MASQNVSTWTPTSLGSTLKAWYLSQLNTTTGVWTSETGSNNTLGSAAPPTATTINGNAAANFTVSQYVVVGFGTNTHNAGLLSNSYTVWCVFQPTTFLLAAGALIGRCITGNTDSTEAGMALSIGSYAMTNVATHWNNRLNLVSGVTPYGYGVAPNDSIYPYSYGNCVASTTRLLTGTTYTVIATYNTTTQPMAQLFLNGRLVATSTTNNGAMTPPFSVPMLVLGSSGSYAGNAGNIYTINQEGSYIGKLGNIGFCDSVLSASDIYKLSWYLNNWGGIGWSEGLSGPSILY